jgi:hypothetical protein
MAKKMSEVKRAGPLIDTRLRNTRLYRPVASLN